MFTYIKPISLSILLCLSSATTLPMQSESLNAALIQYAIPAAKILGGAACIKYLTCLKVDSPAAKLLLGAFDARYQAALNGDGFKFTLITSRDGTPNPAHDSQRIRFNLYPVLAGIYLIKSGIHGAIELYSQK